MPPPAAIMGLSAERTRRPCSTQPSQLWTATALCPFAATRDRDFSGSDASRLDKASNRFRSLARETIVVQGVTDTVRVTNDGDFRGGNGEQVAANFRHLSLGFGGELVC